jgi:hypothetical protein
MNISKNNGQPTLDPAAHYRIELRGQVDAQWLQSFDTSTKIINDEAERSKDITVLSVHTDQAGVVGLIRRLHGIGLTILKLQLDPDKEV